MVRLLLEFEETITRRFTYDNLQPKKHHEDNMAFREKFSADVKTLYSGITVNPFQLNKLTKINNSTAYFPEVVFDTIREMENIGKISFICS